MDNDTTMQIDDPQVQELTAQTETMLALGTSYRVTNAGEYATAGLELQRVKAMQKKLDELRKTMTRPMDIAKKAILDFFRTPEEKLVRAENGIKGAMVGYQSEQDRIRRLAQAKADEAARKEREKLAAQAQKAAQKGRHEQAERLELRAASVVAPVIPSEAVRLRGVSVREVWKFEVTDEAKVPRDYLSVDEAKIRKVVNALKGDAQIPGVRIWAEKAVAARSDAT